MPADDSRVLPNLQRPPALRPGQPIGLIAPGAAVDASRLEAAVAWIEAAGHPVRLGRHVLRRHGYLAGTDEERRADLESLWSDPGIGAVITARGGYGCGRLLPGLDLARLAARPKILVGHSDLTFLLAPLSTRFGLVTFHGPMALNLPAQEEGWQNLLRLLREGTTPTDLPDQPVIRAGRARGRLVGGCLSILTAMLGTPWAVPTAGSVLFLEDINEKPYRIDRMVTQLRQAGAFDEVAGVVFGEMVGCRAGENEAMPLRQVLDEAFRDAPFPVVAGYPSGHGSGRVTLPLGTMVELDAPAAGEGRMRVADPGVLVGGEAG